MLIGMQIPRGSFRDLLLLAALLPAAGCGVTGPPAPGS